MSPQGRRYPSLEARIVANSVLDPDGSDCWIWCGKHQNWYGRINVYLDGRTRSLWAHRVAYEAFRGPIPDGMTVDHVCRESYCVNPAHLRLLTNERNAGGRVTGSRRRRAA